MPGRESFVTKAAAGTAPGPMAMVAIEQHFETGRRIIDDDLASALLTPGMRAVVRTMRSAALRALFIRATERRLPGIWGGIMSRKRYIDEQLLISLGEMDAIVNLGAGFDTRLFRLPGVSDRPSWEVDQPENISAKRELLRKHYGAMPADVQLVPADFDQEDLGAVLAAHGCDPGRRVFYICEAVLQYLTEAGVRSLFDTFARAAPRSRLAFTYIRKAFIDGQEMFPSTEGIYNVHVVKYKTWLSGLDPAGVAGFLAPYGWRVVEHLGYDELAERYVKPTGRQLAFMPIERMVMAEKGPAG